MNVFVTGVGGQLGHDVMKELEKRGHTAVGSDIQGDCDHLLDITDGDAVSALLAAVKALTEKGLRVRVETQPPEKLRYAKCYRFAEGGLSEC